MDYWLSGQNPRQNWVTSELALIRPKSEICTGPGPLALQSTPYSALKASTAFTLAARAAGTAEAIRAAARITNAAPPSTSARG
jgi:hypothetical protein